MDASAILASVEKVTKAFTKQRKREERSARARYRRYDALTTSRGPTVREAAWEIMEEAYLKASAKNTLPASARQIMYAARGHILEVTDKSKLDGQYFSQTLLPDFMQPDPQVSQGRWEKAWIRP